MTESRNNPQEQPHDHAVWGARAMGRVIGKNPRQTFHLLNAGLLPARRVGKQWVSTVGQLRAWLRGER
jgi:hypothetical protein